jgi:hypothetical protein
MPTDDIAEARNAINSVLKHRQESEPNSATTKHLTSIAQQLEGSLSAETLRELATSCKRMSERIKDQPAGTRATLKGAVDALVRAAEELTEEGKALTLKRSHVLDEK